jgi:hypothetical protein
MVHQNEQPGKVTGRLLEQAPYPGLVRRGVVLASSTRMMFDFGNWGNECKIVIKQLRVASAPSRA